MSDDAFGQSPLDERGRTAANAIQTFAERFGVESDGRPKALVPGVRGGRVGSILGTAVLVAALIAAVSFVATRGSDSPTRVQIATPASTSSRPSRDPNALVTLVLKPARGTLNEKQLAAAAKLLFRRAVLIDGSRFFLGTIGHSDHDITMQVPSSVAQFGSGWLARGAVANREVLGTRPWDEPVSASSSTSSTESSFGNSTTTPSLIGKSCKDLVDNRSWFADAVPIGRTHKMCYALGTNLLSGTAAQRAEAQFNEDQGWGVNVTYKSGSFVRIAREYVNKRVAIVLDDQVLSTPVINQGITGDSVRIAGAFTEQTARSLAVALAGGELPTDFTIVKS